MAFRLSALAARAASTIALGAIAVCAGLAAPKAANATTFYFYTYQNGPNTQLDSAHSTTFNFHLDSGVFWDLGGAQLDLKDGSGTTGSIFVDLYQTGNPTALAHLTVTQSQFANLHTIADGFDPNTHALTDQSFNGPGAFTPLLFSSPFTVTGGVGGADYTLAITSDAGTSGSQQYFIKGSGGGVICSTDPGVACDVSNQPPTVVVEAPEPVSLALLGSALAGLGLVRRRRA